MTLDQYMRWYEITGLQMAKMLDRDDSVVSRYRTRDVTPPGEVIAKLLEISNGDITVVDLLRRKT